ncbi:hypothetical protein CK203_098554 [Vitis vinifera]|uniref:Uncharacterized protein n=1 Tax=Vitis vinifera TaxID=29760 RepID=A0A438BMK5_VITVI|nr:hypothetical protein CK203_098554 [Vitis vinifera]
MARTRGAKSSSPSSRKKVRERSPFQNPSLSLYGRKQFLLRRSPRRRSLRRGVILPGQGVDYYKREPGLKAQSPLI